MRSFFLALLLCFSPAAIASADTELKLLFLGDDGPHRPAQRFQELAPVLEARGIELHYTDRLADLQPDRLDRYDGLILYANIDTIPQAEADVLLQFVAGGKGFIPLHCATYCFRNSPELVALMGAQFQRHGSGTFTSTLAEVEHPILKGYHGFTSWDETYIHTRHNEQDRIVLEYRVGDEQAEGRQREPWTWVRTHGEGRVFYTAWGHDQRTWTHAGFHNLVERGIRWACGLDPRGAGTLRAPFVPPEMTQVAEDAPGFEFVDVGPKIPNYTASAQWGTQGEPLREMQKPLPAEASVQHYVTPRDFRLETFAADPQLGGKPIAMNWDERGRLWVCETYDYPNELQPPGKGRDRIRICEDTDNDGRADRFTVFAEGLSIPTAICIYRGGAIVQNGTETLYLKDTDGDDRADERKVLISGWALEDTHGGVSNFQYGHDNWIWAMQGYNNSSPTIEGREQQSFRMGFFRFRLSQTDPPRVEELEFLRSTNNNTWGLGFSEEGLVFGSTANRHPSMYLPIANRYYERVRGWSPEQLTTIADTHLFAPVTENVRQVDHHGGYTAGAGHALYTARAYPQTWWNRTAFVCGPTGHLVGTFVLQPNGTDFQSYSPSNLVAGHDEWSAPIMAEVGPDGNVWILDWYNYIVQHNPTPHGFTRGKGNAYESDLRDKKHGRIYRLTYQGEDETVQESELPDLQSAVACVAALSHPTMLVRKHAQRLLVERGQRDIEADIIQRIQDRRVDAMGLDVGAIHGLWTLAGLGAFSEPGPAYDAVVEALEHPSPGVRRNAIAVLPPASHSLDTLLATDVLTDVDPHVRLAAFLSLADQPASSAAGHRIALAMEDRRNLADRWLPDAITTAAAAHAAGFLPGLSELTTSSEPAAAIVRTVGEHMARGTPSGSEISQWIPSLSQTDPTLAAAVIEGLAAGWSRSHSVTLDETAEQSLPQLFDGLPSNAQAQLIRLSSRWGSASMKARREQVTETLTERLLATEAALSDRVRAAEQLVEFEPDSHERVESLLEIASSPQESPEFAEGVLQALSASRADGVGSQIVQAVKQATPSVRQTAVRVLLARPATTADLLSGLEQGDFDLADLSLEQQQMLNAHPNRGVRQRAQAILRSGNSLPNPDRQRVLEEHLVVASQKGDKEQGLEVFKKHCGKCHQHGQLGENIGPDLTGMAVHPKTELLTHILDPSRSVEGNFRLYTVVTVEGRIHSGMLASETKTSIELIDTEAKRHPILRSDIDELVSSRKSVMPEGFEKQLNKTDLANLLEFLTDKGPFLPLDLRKVATIASDRGMFTNKAAEVERLVFPDWNPRIVEGVPFHLIDPREGSIPNVVLLHGPNGAFPPRMPRRVELPVNSSATAIHLLSGVSGWGHPFGRPGTVSLIVRLHYADGATEDHPLKNGEHFADYIRRVDVPASHFAFDLRGRQIRFLSLHPQRREVIERLELIKGEDDTAPVVMAVTAETGAPL